MPRLFTGLEIPAGVAETLARGCHGLRGARWIEPADYHVTLRFLGDVEAGLAEELHDLLSRARSRPAFEVTVTGLSAFGGDKPRAVIAEVAPSDPLAALQAEHERIAREAGAAPDSRRFTPHVTLARLRREAGAADVALHLAQRGAWSPLRFAATRVALFSARDSTGGGPYVVEGAYPLR